MSCLPLDARYGESVAKNNWYMFIKYSSDHFVKVYEKDKIARKLQGFNFKKGDVLEMQVDM